MILRRTEPGNFWYSDFVRLLFVADGRSPIALGWIQYFVERGDDVFMASTFPCSPGLAYKGFEVTPVAFSGRGKGTPSQGGGSGGIRFRNAIRHFLGPITVSHAARRLRAYAHRVKPDLIHAMRIPFEGMLAADAYSEAPLLTSVWGNDFTLHAPAGPLMRHYTAWTMAVSDGLHADCQRDVRLARRWGLESTKPVLVIPGGGGIREDVFFPPSQAPSSRTVINARGSRAYVRNDVFFRAIPAVLAVFPDARFTCIAQASDQEAARWLKKLGIGHAVTLLPHVSQAELGVLFRASQVMVSPSVHDGTPNSLLEGMFCGCFPIAGDLESIREWITDGQNGLLVDATKPAAVSDAILRALKNENLRRDAAGSNRRLISERALYARCMSQASSFYERLIARTT